MAQRTEVRVFLTDDLDGTELPEGKGRTIKIGWDDQWYEIDLKDENARRMTDTVMGYVDHARKVRGRSGRRGSGHRASPSRQDREETKAARAWLVEHGFLSADSRGRISGELWEKYRNRGQLTMPEPAKPQKAAAAEQKQPAKATAQTTKATGKQAESKELAGAKS